MFRTIRIKTCPNSTIYSLVYNVNGDSFRVAKGLEGLQECGWFLKHSITAPFPGNVTITIATLKSTKAVEHCILYDLHNYTCDNCCYKIMEKEK